MKRKVTTAIIIIIIIIAIVFYYPIRSYAVMKIFSTTEENKSIMHENGYRIKMPSDKMWYPFVITFNTTGFGRYSGTGADMSIMYNFGKFYNRKSSLVYDEHSPYYSAFYGAYALSMDDGIYGFDDNNIIVDDLINAFKYDYCRLVLASVGCKYPEFEVKSYSTQDNVSFIGYDNWTMIEAEIHTLGMSHREIKSQRAYIQYGIPTIDYGDSFYDINTNGRLYARHFPEYNSTIVIYVMAKDMDVIDECDVNILSKTRIIDK